MRLWQGTGLHTRRPRIISLNVVMRKNLSDVFPILNSLKIGHALSPLLFNFALNFAIWTVYACSWFVLICKFIEWKLAYVEKSMELLLVASRPIGLEVNAEKLKCMLGFVNGMQDKITT